MKCIITQFLQLPNAPRLVSYILLGTLLSQFPNLFSCGIPPLC